MKVVNLRQAILQAWKERWTDYQWAINMKNLFPKGPTWDLLGLSGETMQPLRWNCFTVWNLNENEVLADLKKKKLVNGSILFFVF